MGGCGQDQRAVTVWSQGLGQDHNLLPPHPCNGHQLHGQEHTEADCSFVLDPSSALSQLSEPRPACLSYSLPASRPPVAPSHPPGQACPAHGGHRLVSMETVPTHPLHPALLTVGAGWMGQDPRKQGQVCIW